MEEKKKQRSGLLTGLIVGGAVGSVLSLFLANKKNREKTMDISKKIFQKGKGSIEGFLEKYKKEEK